MIHIITPVTRIENLNKIQESFPPGKIDTWWIIADRYFFKDTTEIVNNFVFYETVRKIKFDLVADGVAGHSMRNFVLDQIPPDSTDWVYSVDDDNILHPGLLDELTDDRDIITVGQLNKDGSQRLDGKTIKLNHIDTAQFAFRRNVVGDLRFYASRYDADGVFIEELYRKIPEKFTIIDKNLSYYNYLK